MRLATASILALAVVTAGCAGRKPTLANSGTTPLRVSGVWDGVIRATITEGMGSGDTRIEKQEWHLSQAGAAISGYYIAALTFVSGDGRPYVCSREPQFSAVQRYDIAGRLRGGLIEIEEVTQKSEHGRCDPGNRKLLRYQGKLQGDTMTLVNGSQRQTLYRSKEGDAQRPGIDLEVASDVRSIPESPFPDMDLDSDDEGPAASARAATGGTPADVSGMWIWEHHGTVPGGDEKQEREEWHVTQEGSKLTGYYDRIVHQVSSDGNAYRCSMALDFRITTRYQISGEVRGDQVIIYEKSFEVLQPSACDNGKRRLDAYEGQVSTEEIRLVWGVGGQVLRRPRPDVPTQRF
ncbi:MAG TPA: hypothetical protein VFH73_24705 [Polyangia bacterium]|jgi:hypothetical protein|nr:hypothetical protein [Polyangia bacterium]